MLQMKTFNNLFLNKSNKNLNFALGEMKNFLQKLFRKAPQTQATQAQTPVPPRPQPIECKSHNYKRLPNIKANEICLDCGVKICYLCSHSHIEQKCTVACIKPICSVDIT